MFQLKLRCFPKPCAFCSAMFSSMSNDGLSCAGVGVTTWMSLMPNQLAWPFLQILIVKGKLLFVLELTVKIFEANEKLFNKGEKAQMRFFRGECVFFSRTA